MYEYRLLKPVFSEQQLSCLLYPPPFSYENIKLSQAIAEYEVAPMGQTDTDAGTGNDTDSLESLGEDNTLTDVLGDHPKVRIIAALLSQSRRDLNSSDIARLAGIERSTFYNHKDDLLAYGIMEQTRTIGNSPMFQINRDNEAAKTLGKLDHDLRNIFLEGGEADESHS